MKFFSDFEKGKMLGFLPLVVLIVGWTIIVQASLASECPTFDLESQTLSIPKVCVGIQQYEVKIKLKDYDTVNGPKPLSIITFPDSENPDFQGELNIDKFLTLLKENEISPKTKKFYDPIEEKEKEYRGVSTNDVFDLVYGEKWRDSEEIQFNDLKGRSHSTFVDRFLEQESWLVYEEVGNDKFAIIKNPAYIRIELGPFFLVWDNKVELDATYPLLQQLTHFGWFPQVNEVKLTSFAKQFPNAFPQELPEGLKEGFISTRKYCLNCHRVNSEGGWLSKFDLTTGEVISKYKSDVFITSITSDSEYMENKNGKIVLIPKNMRLPLLTNRDIMGEKIFKYLTFMEKRALTQDNCLSCHKLDDKGKETGRNLIEIVRDYQGREEDFIERVTKHHMVNKDGEEIMPLSSKSEPEIVAKAIFSYLEIMAKNTNTVEE
jgi:cytochrome c551/c552